MLALDPMLEGGLLLAPLLIVLLKVVVVFVIGLVATMLMVWFERKVTINMVATKPITNTTTTLSNTINKGVHNKPPSSIGSRANIR